MANNDLRNQSSAPLAGPNSANSEEQKNVQRAAEADRMVKAPSPPEPAEDEPRNLTRETIETLKEAEYIAAGKSPEEAKAAAKKRALEMIPADAK